MSAVSMIKSKVTISEHLRVYDYEFSSLLYKLELSIKYRKFSLRDGCNMVNNHHINNICHKLTQRKPEEPLDEAD